MHSAWAVPISSIGPKRSTYHGLDVDVLNERYDGAAASIAPLLLCRLLRLRLGLRLG